MKVAFYRHNIDADDVREVVEALQGVFLTTGPRTAEFERRFGALFGAPAAVGFSSWTTAAFLVLKAWGIGPGDEVLVPAMTFISTANVVLHCGATPVLVDVEPATGNIDPARMEAAITPRTRAVIPVHLYGQMADMRAIRDVADAHGLRVLEDCAHCIEGRRDGIVPSQLGDAGTFSFYATKNITCGEGGAAVSRDASLTDRLKSLRLHGMSLSAADRYTSRYRHWDMLELGYKANMSDIQAALLLHQISRLDDLLARKEAICRRYEARFDAAGVDYPRVLPGSISARHLFTVWAPRGRRDEVLAKLQDREIGVAVNFRPIHLLTYYRERYAFQPGTFPVAEEIGDRTISIPMYPRLSDEEIEYVADEVVTAIRG